MGRATRCLQEPCLCSAGFMRHPWRNNQDWIDWIVWIFGVCTASTNNPIVWPERIVCCRWSMLAARCLCLWRIPIGNKLKLEDLQMHCSADGCRAGRARKWIEFLFCDLLQPKSGMCGWSLEVFPWARTGPIPLPLHPSASLCIPLPVCHGMHDSAAFPRRRILESSPRPSR